MKKFKDSPEWKQFTHKNKDKIAIYLEAMYSQSSELNEIQDFAERTSAALKKAGLDEAEREIQEIVKLQNTHFFDLVFIYHVYNNSNKYQHLCSLQQLLLSIQKLINKPIDDLEAANIDALINSKVKMTEHASSLIKSIEGLIAEIFPTKEVAKKAESKVRMIVTLEQRLKEKQG